METWGNLPHVLWACTTAQGEGGPAWIQGAITWGQTGRMNVGG